MPGIPEQDTVRAHDLAKKIATRAKDGGFVPVEGLETVNEWVGRWASARTAKGLRTVKTDPPTSRASRRPTRSCRASSPSWNGDSTSGHPAGFSVATAPIAFRLQVLAAAR
jgi:hypothetical protein